MSAPPILPIGSFADRVVVVTGGGSSIGEAIAVEFACLGAAVVVAGRTAERLDGVAERITTEGGRVGTHVLDVRDRDAVERMSVEHGHMDHPVNSAAGQFRVAPYELSPGGWQAVVDIVLYGIWHCTQAVERHMIERERGGRCSPSAQTWPTKVALTPSTRRAPKQESSR